MDKDMLESVIYAILVASPLGFVAWSARQIYVRSDDHARKIESLEFSVANAVDESKVREIVARELKSFDEKLANFDDKLANLKQDQFEMKAALRGITNIVTDIRVTLGPDGKGRSS